MRKVVYGLLAVGSAAASAAASVQYNVVNLGPLPYSQNAAATGINSAGTVAGYSQGGNNGQAFQYSGGVLSGLGTLGGASATSEAINSSGQIAGFSSLSSGPQFDHGFIFSPATGMVDIGSLSNGTATSFAYGINDSGTVAGYSSVTAQSGLEAISYNASAGLQPLGYMPGGTRSEAFAINNNGVIVGDGDYAGSANPFTSVHAFTYTSAAGFTNLGTLGGSNNYSTARGINNLNEVVGTSQNVAGNYEAFAYNAAGGMVDLGALGPGSLHTSSGAFGVNDHGVIVGNSSYNTSTSGLHAFVSTGVGMTDLNSLISPTSGWSLTTAYAINNSGIIVGSGVFNGTTSAFELVTSTNAQNLTWNNGGIGNGTTWDTASLNWNNGTGTTAYSNTDNGSTGDLVTFNDNNNGNYNISIPSTLTPTSTTINTNSGTGYTFSGQGGIGGSGGLTKLGTGLLTINTSNSYTGGTNISGGTVMLGVAAALPVGTNLTINGSGTSVVAKSVGTAYALQVGTLNISGGTLDLKNNDLIVHGGTLTAVSSLVANGYNSGKWNGSTGIINSAAASNLLMALGVIVNDNGAGTPLYGASGTIAGTFGGATPLDGDVLVKYTYYGDANLDGKVDGTDYGRIDAAYLADNATPGSMTGWYNGDFNYDGVINGSDYTLIDNTFNTQGGVIASAVANPSAMATTQIANPSAIPEPATLSLVGLGAIGLIGRRRRH